MLPSGRPQAPAHSDSTAVVLDLQELESSLLNGNANRRRSGVERVFDQLLERVRRSLDDLWWRR